MTRPRLVAEFLLDRPPATGEVRWSGRDTAIYNLGIGFGAAAAADERLLPYVLEEQARAVATMVSVLDLRAATLLDPRSHVDLAAAVHGEEAIVLHRPLPAAGALIARRSVEAIWDKGERGAVMRLLREFLDVDTQAVVATVRSTIMLRNNGGYGGSNEGAPRPLRSPERPAEGHVDMPTLPEQAMLYRLAGDRNPLHVDPAFARRAGFPRPILMGLCSFAIAGRALVAALGRGEPERLTALRVRFSSALFPGETLRIEHWRLDDGEIAFRGRAIERDAVVLDGGRARIAEGA